MIAALLGAVVGLMMGLTGAGSVLAVPLMMWALGWSQAQAVPAALVAVCVSACIVTAITFDVRQVRYKAAMLMALAGVPAISAGLAVAHSLPEIVLNVALAAVLLFVAVRMLRSASSPEAAQPRAPIVRLNPETGRIVWNAPTALTIGGCGAVTGFLSGLFGTGGGFFLTPSLRTFTEMPMHTAVATTLMAVAMISASGLAALALQGHALPWMVALPFMAGTLAGMFAGRQLAPRFKGPALERAFALVVLVVAVRTIIKAVYPG